MNVKRKPRPPVARPPKDEGPHFAWVDLFGRPEPKIIKGPGGTWWPIYGDDDR